MILQHNLFHWCRSVSVLFRQARHWRFLLFLKAFKSATQPSREEGVKVMKIIIIMSVKGVEVPSNYFFVGISGRNADGGILEDLALLHIFFLQRFSSSLSSLLSESKVETRLPCLKRPGQDEICDSVRLCRSINEGKRALLRSTCLLHLRSCAKASLWPCAFELKLHGPVG